MNANQTKPLKSIPDFIKEDAPWGHSKTWDLIKAGTLKTVRVGRRQYILMSSFTDLIPDTE
jgi:hypothetical protein